MRAKNSKRERLTRHGAVKLERLYFDSRKSRFPVGGLMVMLLVPLAVFSVPP